MRFIQEEPTEIILDKSSELQALGWAASEMRRAEPGDAQKVTAYNTALRATEFRHSGSESRNFSIQGEEADIVLSVLQQWVDLGPPQKEEQVTDAARAKSYKTAKKLVTQIAELTKNFPS